jgi:hypothetical protein
MSLTKYETREEQIKAYTSKYLENNKVEWLIEHGKIRENVFFKGETGDRYTIYVATKRNKNVVDFHTVHNAYDHGTSSGDHIATIKDYVIHMVGRTGRYWHSSVGYTIKQLMRQGVCPRDHLKHWKIRFCRSAFFMRLYDGTEFTPWVGMKLDLQTGTLLNKPIRQSVLDYRKAKDSDKRARKANRIANKNNADALLRYHAAKGNFALLPIDDVFKHRNVEYRTDIINFNGLEKVLSTLETKIEDEDTVDGRFYRLINVRIPDLASGQERHDWGLYLEMINPSTGESHFEGVANARGGTASNNGWRSGGELESATVKAALSWRDGDGIITSGQSWNATSSDTNYVPPIKMT